MRITKYLIPLLLVLAFNEAHADDGAASIAAGGLVIMGRETRVTMAKEVLQISPAKVVVDYDFRNDSDTDVITEVAFPIPPYREGDEELEPSQLGFDDFRLWVNGSRRAFDVEVRAYLMGTDYTALLNLMHLDIPTFGHSVGFDNSNGIKKLTVSQRNGLAKLGLVDALSNDANWEVRKKYHWKQDFSAHTTVHIRHAYTPALGSTNSVRYGMESPVDPDMAKEIKSFCIDDRLHSILDRVVKDSHKDASYSYVDFILTTANTWKTPIEDFQLIVERPHDKGAEADDVSFCWDGPVTKVDANHLSAHATNFIPKKELRIGFFAVEGSRQSSSTENHKSVK